jgi:hypothetical protein
MGATNVSSPVAILILLLNAISVSEGALLVLLIAYATSCGRQALKLNIASTTCVSIALSHMVSTRLLLKCYHAAALRYFTRLGALGCHVHCMVEASTSSCRLGVLHLTLIVWLSVPFVS